MAQSEVLIERHGGTAVVTLNAPERRNVLSSSMVAAIASTFDSLEQDASVRCVVLTGAGPSFCAGAELSTLERAAAGDFRPVRAVYDGFLRVLESPIPTIAAVNGPAVGAGFNLALACDLRMASESARFDTRFAALHLHPGGGHTWLLTRAVGAQHAAMACLFSEVWDAETALARGLVAAVYYGHELLPAAIALASRLDPLDQEFVRKLTATLRLAASGASHAEVMAMETSAQRWSVREPSFLAGLAEITSRVGRGR